MSIPKFPKGKKIIGRTSSITNSFVNSIIPYIEPKEDEIEQVLSLLGMNTTDIECIYCGDKASEWDHLRPLVINKRPTGYISDIKNFVPSCGKCNQSKGAQDWKTWMLGTASKSPFSRGIEDLENRVRLIENFVKWGNVKPIDVEQLVPKEVWEEYWNSCEEVHKLMQEYQKLADEIKRIILESSK